jgi:hypothetical protein
MCEPLDVLGEAIGIERLDRLSDSDVERASAFVKEAPVGHVVSERVLERVGRVRDEGRLVQELGELEAREAIGQGVRGSPGDRREHRDRDVRADDRGDLEEVPVVRGQAVDARREDRLHRPRHVVGLRRLH